MLKYTRGQTVTWGLRSTPEYDGTEDVLCDLKKAVSGAVAPPDDAPVIISPTVTFSPSTSEDTSHWLFTLTPEQSASLTEGTYITDAKVTYTNGFVDVPKPIRVQIVGRVTK